MDNNWPIHIKLDACDGQITVFSDDILPHSPFLQSFIESNPCNSAPLFFASKKDLVNIIGFVNGKPIDSTSTVSIVRRLEMKNLLSRMLLLRWYKCDDNHGLTLHDVLLDLKDICNSIHLETRNSYLGVFSQIICSIGRKGSVVKKDLIELLFSFLFQSQKTDKYKELSVIFKKLYDSDEDMFDALRIIIANYLQPGAGVIRDHLDKSVLPEGDSFNCTICYNNDWTGRSKYCKLKNCTFENNCSKKSKQI